MFPDAFIPLGQVPATAARSERAAANSANGRAIRTPSQSSRSRWPISKAPSTSSPRRCGSWLKPRRSGATRMTLTHGTLPPEASALLWHLRSVADTLTDARDGCLTSRRWAHSCSSAPAPNPSQD